MKNKKYGIETNIPKYCDINSYFLGKPCSLQVFSAMIQFYSIIALEAMVKPICFKPSHEAWMMRFRDYKDSFIDGLAKIVYDYTVCAVFLELRHSSMSNLVIEGFKDSPRDSAIKGIKHFTPDSILRLGVKSFSEPWLNGYGGSAWLAIAKAGLMYGKIPNMVFIDHCNDLSHNNGAYYDKEFGIFSLTDYVSGYGFDSCSEETYFENFLDLKRVEKKQRNYYQWLKATLFKN